MLTSPGLHRYTGGLTLLITYGHRVMSNKDRYLQMANESMDVLANEIAAAGKIWLVDLFPIRESLALCYLTRIKQGANIPGGVSVKHIPTWMPGAGFKRQAAVWKTQMEQFVNEPYEMVKDRVVRACIVRALEWRLTMAIAQGHGRAIVLLDAPRGRRAGPQHRQVRASRARLRHPVDRELALCRVFRYREAS